MYQRSKDYLASYLCSEENIRLELALTLIVRLCHIEYKKKNDIFVCISLFPFTPSLSLSISAYCLIFDLPLFFLSQAD
jgi:hypothetical protein